MIRALPLASLVLLVGCGKIYIDPVSIEAKGEVPAVMFLFDKSGSMALPLQPTGTCGTCQFPSCNESTCPTRMGTARSWASAMLAELGPRARWGLTIYPADNVCKAAGAEQVLAAIPDAPSGDDVAMKVALLTVGGGTPTAASVAFASQAFPSTTAERIIVLFTDGVPNCNGQNPNTCVMPTECSCTLSGGNCGAVVNDGDPNNFCRRGCLDEDSTVAAIRSLAEFGISTTVIGFSSDATSSTFDAMARASLERAPCAADSDCFGNTCMSGRCTGGALKATDAASLAALNPLLKSRFAVSERCRWTLLTALPAGLTGVQLGTRDVLPGEYLLETPTRVRFLGDDCKALLDDETLTPRFFGQP